MKNLKQSLADAREKPQPALESSQHTALLHLCACGCGKRVKNNKYTFLWGHKPKELIAAGHAPRYNHIVRQVQRMPDTETGRLAAKLLLRQYRLEKI